MDLFIAQDRLSAIVSPYRPRSIGYINAKVGVAMPFNLYFCSSAPNEPLCPQQVTRYAAASITMKLQQDGQANAAATQSSWSEIVPTTTAPTITQVHAGTATTGEYDRITFASQPGSGSFAVTMKGGVIQAKGAVSATARIYPGITSPSEVESAFASMIGAPFTVEFFGNNTLMDIHASTVGGTAPTVTEVNTAGLQYLYGWSGSLDLSSVNTALVGVTDLYLVVLLTPSGGVQYPVLKLPVQLLF